MYMTEAEKRQEFIDSQRFLALCDQDRAKHRDRILHATMKARNARRGQRVLLLLAIVLCLIGVLGRLLN